MSLPKARFIGLLGTLCLTVRLLAPGVCAGQNADVVRGPARTIFATVKNDAPAGVNPLYNVYVTVGANQIAFGLPEGFRLNAYQQKILLVSADNSCFLTFRIINPTLSAAGGLDSDTCRKLVFSQYPGAKISSETACNAANHVGTTFGLQWLNSGGGMQSISMAFVPSAAGVMQIGLVTVADRGGDDSTYFKLVLASLRTNEGGKYAPHSRVIADIS